MVEEIRMSEIETVGGTHRHHACDLIEGDAAARLPALNGAGVFVAHSFGKSRKPATPAGPVEMLNDAIYDAHTQVHTHHAYKSQRGKRTMSFAPCGMAAETIPTALRKLRKRAGYSMEELAQEIGYKKASGYQRYESDTDYKRDRIGVGMAEKLAAALVGRGKPPITEDEVLALAGINSAALKPPGAGITSETTAYDDTGDVSARLQGINNWPRDVPILGTAVGGSGSDFTLNTGEVIDYARRPPSILHRRGSHHDVYALYVRGSSMSPWRDSGGMIFVDPMRPPRPGDKVVVQLTNEHGEGTPAFLKVYVGQTTSTLKLKQYNPEKPVELPLSKVAAIQRVFEWEELLAV